MPTTRNWARTSDRARFRGVFIGSRATSIHAFFRLAIAVAVSAACEILSLPDFGMSWLVFLAPVPLLWVLPRTGWKGAFLAGWAAKSLALGGVFHWIITTAMELAGFSPAAAVGVWAVHGLVQGLTGGVAGLAIRLLMDLPWPARWLGVPMVWVAADAWLPHLFPYGLGHALWESPAWLQGAEVTGIEGTTFVIVLLSAGIAEGIARPREIRGRVSVVVGVLVAAMWWGYGMVREAEIREAEDRSPRLKVLMVQPDIGPEMKRRKDIETRREIEERLFRLSEEGNASAYDLIVWPEGVWPWEWESRRTGPLGEEARRGAERMRAAVRAWGRPLLFGTVTRPGKRARNSLVLLGADGLEKARYDKQRLLAFGEYLPLRERFPTLRNRIPGVGDLEAGSSFVALEVGSLRLAPSICYEAIHGPLIRQAVRETGADVLVNLTNDGWFGPSGAPQQHLMDQVPRAVEQRVPLIRSTMTGISAVVSASGSILARTGVGETVALSVEVPVPSLGGSLMGRLGPWFPACCGSVTLLLLALAGLRCIASYRSGKKSRTTTTGK